MVGSLLNEILASGNLGLTSYRTVIGTKLQNAALIQKL